MKTRLSGGIVGGDIGNIPRCFDGWCVVSHQGVGGLEWNCRKIGLLLEGGQENGQSTIGKVLQTTLDHQKVLNSCVLDWLLSNKKRIPRKWKGKHIFFWGTLYCVSGGSGEELYVRYLFKSGGKWRWSFYWLGGQFSSYDPRAVVL